jgi:hypothetical protein
MNGGRGDDLMLGGNGEDNMKGGLGDDVINGQQGLDLIDGGWGDYDRCSYEEESEPVINCEEIFGDGGTPPDVETRPLVTVPPGHYPPPGLCRLWFVDRPPGQQPPPEDCGIVEAKWDDLYNKGQKVTVVYGG